MIMTKDDSKFCQGDKQMLMKTLLNTYRDVTRQLAPRRTVATVPVRQKAANASQWANRCINNESQGRRLRRQRRMERLGNRPINGWTVRTW
jgi:hypothetical protein